MGFDKEIWEWILEHLFREVKTISLKTLDSFVRDGSISESILDILEGIAKICSDDRDSLVFLDESIKLAYCMVAVDCTVRFNEGTDNGGGGLYLEAVKRIWRGRIVYLENSSCADLLISDQLRTWRDDIEAAVYDGFVSKRIVAINTRLEALKALRSFSAEAWKTMCSRPTFLEQAAKKMGRSLLVSQNLSGSENLSPVQEETPCSSGMHDLARESVVEKASDTVYTKLLDNTVSVHIERDKAPVQQTTVDPTLMTPVMKRNQDGSAYCQDGDGSLKQAMQTKNQSDQRNMNSEPSMQIESQPVQRNLRDQDQMVEENTVAVPAVAFRDKEVENLNALPKLKHVAGNSKRSKRGVQIGDAEDLMVEILKKRVALLGSAEVSEVQEALRSSTLGLHAVVNDPLQEALNVADAVMSGIGRTGIIVEPSVHTQDRMDINMANHSNDQHVEAVRTKAKSLPGTTTKNQNDDKGDGTHVDEGTGDNLGTKRLYQRTDLTRPGLMLRNSTARTYEIFESFVFGFPPNWHDCAASSFIRKHTGTFDQEDVNVSEPHDKMNMAAGAIDNTSPITVSSFIPEEAQSGAVNVRKSKKLLGTCETVMDLSNVSLEENGNSRKANKNDPACLVGCNKSRGSTLKDNTNVALRFSTLQYESHVHIVQSLVNADCVVRNDSDGSSSKVGKQLASDSKTRKGNKKEKLTSRFAPGDKKGKVHKSVADAFKNPDEKKLKKISTGASKKKSDSKSKEDVTCTPKRKLKFDSEVSPLNMGENSTSITSSESLSLKRSRSDWPGYFNSERAKCARDFFSRE